MQLEMDHVWRTYRVGDSDVVALGDVSVRIQSGELVAVVGPSGSGKSTFLQLIGLLDSPSEGAVRFDGQDVGSLGDADRTRIRLRALGFVFQRFHLLNHLTLSSVTSAPAASWSLLVWATDCCFDRRSSPAGSVSASPSHARLPTARALCWLTSPRVSCTVKTPSACSICFGR